MIKFIQRYQKYFYIVITTMIVISFSFFGTYGAIESSPIHEQLAFTALDGTKVSRGELEQMAFFLQTDLHDKRIYPYPHLAPNFLNDGVIQKDFLETGMGAQLAESYTDLLKPDLELRMQREKSYKPYVHPQSPFVSAETVWKHVSPTLKHHLDTLQKGVDPMSPEEFDSRVDLYLAERNFPAPYLAEMLWRQQKQYGWLAKDENLRHLDLSLFGYHTLDDWFGPKFVRLIAEFIFNAAIVAEQKGYSVSKEEVWSDLVKNANLSFSELAKAHMTGAASQKDYLNDQLRKMGMDRARATKIWQKVMLFRRLFHDLANASQIEPKTLSLPNAWASETLEGETYHLPQPLHLSDLMALAGYEYYVTSTSKASKSDLLPPQEPLAASEIALRHPELVEKRYLVGLKQVDLKGLEARISFRDTLNWETEEENFNLLKKEFADLGIQDGTTLENRIAALDSLPNTMRNKVDSFARKQIALAHPENVESALSHAEEHIETLTVRLKGGKEPLSGVKDRKDLIDRLDRAKRGEFLRIPGEGFVYEIRVIDPSKGLEIMTFEEAKNSGILTESVNKALESYYDSIKNGHEDKFRKEGGSFKNFSEVKRQVAEMWLEPQLKEINQAAQNSLKDKAPIHMIPDIAASLRFVAWAEKVKEDPDKMSFVRQPKAVETESGQLEEKSPWVDQFKWEKADTKIKRGSDDEVFEKEKLFLLKPHEWSRVLTPPNGDLSFFFLKDKKTEKDPELLALQTLRLRYAIGAEAERTYMRELLEEIKAKGAISFDYLNQPVDSPESQLEPAMEPEVSPSHV